MLLNNGTHMDTKNNYDWTALYVSIDNNHPDVSELLVCSGADFITQCRHGNTAMIYAVCKNYCNVVRAMFYKNEFVKYYDTIKSHMLETAVRQASVEMVSIILETHPDLNSRYYSGNTALHLAAARGDIRIIQTLLIHGADINALNAENYTPFRMAIMHGNSNLVSLLHNTN